ncbi:MAG: hypothetical protein ABI274_03920 [Ktedonobacterales bacterium]
MCDVYVASAYAGAGYAGLECSAPAESSPTEGEDPTHHSLSPQPSWQVPASASGANASELVSAAAFTALMERQQPANQVFLRGLVSNAEVALDPFLCGGAVMRRTMMTVCPISVL